MAGISHLNSASSVSAASGSLHTSTMSHPALNAPFARCTILPAISPPPSPQAVAPRPRLDDLDGLPAINVNDVPLPGVNSIVKRSIDIVLSATALTGLAIPLGLIALAVKVTLKGPGLFSQEGMGLDGRAEGAPAELQ